MLKRRKGLIAKVLLLTMCTTFMTTAITFAEKNIISSTKLTGSATTVSNESDFEFDSETGTITSYKVREAEGTELVIPSTINGVAVKHIGNSAFANHYNLAEVIIPDGVTIIGFAAFTETSSLQSIKIPSSVTTIGGCAFFRSGIKNITIPQGVKNIEIKAFGSSSLRSITISDSVTSIADYAFENCVSLSSVTIPEGVKEIGDCAFSHCSSLTSITIPRSINNLSSFLFSNSGLRSITIPDSITYIQHGVFSSCNNLKSMTIPDSVTKMDYGTFNGYNGIVYVNSERVKQLALDSGLEASRIILNGTNSIKVKSIELDKKNLTIVKGQTIALTANVLPDNAVNKEVNWSSGDINVATVDKNGSITGIKQGETIITCIAKDGSGIKATCIVTVTDIIDELDFGFDVVTGTITSYSGPDGVLVIPGAIQGVTVKHIGKRAFSNCSNSQITIPSSVTSIEDYAFLNCKKLTEIKIPRSVTVIENRAFMSCTNLKEIIIPEGVTTLGEAAFLDCSSLTSVKILGNIKEISSNTFNMCESLKDITIPSSVSSIGYVAFGNCSNLKSITIPSSVTNIEQGAFDYYDGIFYVNNKDTKQRIIDSGVDASRIILNVTNPIKVKNIELDKKRLNIIKGQTATLTAKVLPNNADNKEVRWSSSNNNIVTVDSSGNVKAIAKGSATITCTAKDGSKVYAKCAITVRNSVSVINIKLNKKILSLIKGKRTTLTALVTPSTATNKEVIWKSSNKNVATVNEKGEVKAVGAGVATITCTAKDGSGKIDTCKVIVMNKK
ncbi:MAG: leucine-rich repeat protein [Clostridiaceae bacterium]